MEATMVALWWRPDVNTYIFLNISFYHYLSPLFMLKVLIFWQTYIHMYYQDLWDVSASENKYVALFATHSFTYSRYVLEFHKNLQTIRIGFVKIVSFGNQSLLPILVQNCQQNRVDVQKGVKLMFLNLIYDAIILSTCKNT